MNYASMVCRHDPTRVKEIDGVYYYGASQKGAPKFDGDLMVNFTRVSDIPSVVNIPELAPFVDISFEEVMVPWPDFGIPKVYSEFWQALHDYIMSKGMRHVCFHCEAGHGRTGTGLCAMMICIQGYSVHDAINHIRSVYCEEAVETHEQVEYLCMLDEDYNARHYEEKDYPIPSIVIMMEKRQKENSTNKSDVSGLF